MFISPSGVCPSGDDPDLCTAHPTVGTLDLGADGGVTSVFAADPAGIDFGDVPIDTASAATSVAVTLDAGYAWAGASAAAPFGLSGGTCNNSATVSVQVK